MAVSGTTVLLGSITSWLSGGTPDRTRQRYWVGQIPWISATTIKVFDLETSDQFVSPDGVRAGSKMAPVGSTLVLVRGMSVHREVRAGVVTQSVAFNQDIKALVPTKSVHSRFLTYSLLAHRSQILSLVTSAGNGTGVLETGAMRRLPIWLPAFSVQAAVVEMLDDAARQVATLERLIAKKEAMKQGAIQQLLAGRTRLPSFTGAWSTQALGRLGSFCKGQGIKRDDVSTSGVSCIRYGELYTTYRGYTSATVSYVSPQVAATAFPIRHGDLLFAGSGETREEIGMCVAFIGKQRAVAGGDIIVLRAPDVNPVYLASLVNTPKVAAQKARLGQGDAIVHINSCALASIAIELPPREEQDVIAAVLVDMDNETRLLEARLTKAKAIKQGMMQALLTGRTRLPVAEAAA